MNKNDRRYRMTQIGYRNGKPLLRGTGFNTEPGGITWIGDDHGWVPRLFWWFYR